VFDCRMCYCFECVAVFNLVECDCECLFALDVSNSAVGEVVPL
jgi:hypothetical protein